VSAAGVVEVFDVTVDGARELDPSLPAPAVEELYCIRPQKLSTTALSYGEPMAPIDGARPASRTLRLNAQDRLMTDNPLPDGEGVE